MFLLSIDKLPWCNTFLSFFFLFLLLYSFAKSTCVYISFIFCDFSQFGAMLCYTFVFFSAYFLVQYDFIKKKLGSTQLAQGNSIPMGGSSCMIRLTVLWHFRVQYLTTYSGITMISQNLISQTLLYDHNCDTMTRWIKMLRTHNFLHFVCIWCNRK